MSLTYTDEIKTAPEENYTPVYARRGTRKKQRKIKTWMILAPIGAVVLAGSAAAMLMSGETEPTPLTEPVAPTPLAASPLVAPATVDTAVAAAPLTSASSPAPVAAAPVAAPAPAPVVAREAAPVRRAAPARRAAPVQAAPAAEAEVVAEPTGPQPYAAASSTPATTPSLNTGTPESTLPATPPRAPAISVQPLN